jgi:hypothetical protein
MSLYGPRKEGDWKFDNIKLWLNLKDLIHFSARKLRLGTELRGERHGYRLCSFTDFVYDGSPSGGKKYSNFRETQL